MPVDGVVRMAEFGAGRNQCASGRTREDGAPCHGHVARRSFNEVGKYPGKSAVKTRVAVPAGLEPATSAFEARHSIQLSYGTAGAAAKWRGARSCDTPPGTKN